jgi:CubicO group peptidase (beta-lactamase class C family)
MTSNQIGNLTAPELFDGNGAVGYGFGVAVVKDPALAQTSVSPGSFRWGGVYGHSWFVDPSAHLTVVLMTNTAIEGMAGKLSSDIESAVYGR